MWGQQYGRTYHTLKGAACPQAPTGGTRTPLCQLLAARQPTLELIRAGVVLAMAACSAVCSLTVTGTAPVPLNCGTGKPPVSILIPMKVLPNKRSPPPALCLMTASSGPAVACAHCC